MVRYAKGIGGNTKGWLGASFRYFDGKVVGVVGPSPAGAVRAARWRRQYMHIKPGRSAIIKLGEMFPHLKLRVGSLFLVLHNIYSFQFAYPVRNR